MTLPMSKSHTEFILATIEQLRSYSQVNVQSGWVGWECDCQITEIDISQISAGNPVNLNAKAHIAWTRGKKVLWLVQKFVVPANLQGYSVAGLSLRLALVWWADVAEIYVNGELVLQGDLFDCSPRVLLSQGVKAGDEFVVTIRLVSPGHDDGALVRSHLIYESNDHDHPDPGFMADELAVVQLFLAKFAPERLVDLAQGLREVTNPRGTQIANKELREVYQRLSGLINSLNPKIYLLGHAHLDLAWLWPVSDTWKAAQNTFESVLRLQADFPELIFCHSTPALYAWVEEHRPDLFRQIQAQVAAGRWEVVGGLWVEPELNLISGESIVRQLLYGQRYIQAKFGKLSPVAWLPDTFGFCATLPQFLVNAGIEFFVTQKLRWNDTSQFDYDAFWWRSPDGSQIFSMMSALIGQGIDPVQMATYADEWQSKTGFKQSLWLPGVGDHGGGPTRDMLETAQRWQRSDVFPDLEFTTSQKYLQQIQEQANNLLPTWNDELYLEFHRGCYTTHADQKRYNRRCENLLYQAELFASLASLICGVTYPLEIEKAWKQVLFNQFHDILPGSSITQVYQDALPEWQQVEAVGTKILQESLLAIASQTILPPPPHPESEPIFIFNALNWQRSEVVCVTLPESHPQWQVYNLSGQPITSQISADRKLLFLAPEIPPVGYRIFWLSPTSPTPQSPNTPDWTLENEFLRVIINPDTGDLSSVFDKTHQREILTGAGNQLQAFKDSGQYWDAWNIDPNYAQHPLPPTQLKSLAWLDQGLVQSRVRVVRQLGKSEFCQDYILQAGSPLLKIASTVNWQENQVMVKAAFPVNVEADFATYEIPCGVIRRPTQPQTPAEQAKWEVPALRWADLTGETQVNVNNVNIYVNIYGVSLLNDCKYGYDSKSNQLRLTLLRSPNWPDPKTDRGLHEFTYALYPHGGSWETANTVQRGYELNIPLQVVINPPTTQDATPSPGESVSFLNLSAANLILMAFKPSEDNPQQFILRCYECQGDTAQLSLQSHLGLSLGNAVDLLEAKSSQPQNSIIEPWKIASFEVNSEQ
ncbi:alpha-mannosidase [Anabaenopsis tanganyikae CS-531]|uniref:Alpha-mannosidase n=2 Tax=Anabaenopsis TaxID=110103 RepID=A0ABT6KCL8_9CYAN|nr:MULTISPECIES: alpha-mannosidase [Anabaenopsis]MDB9539697.1 alpha-mannosidase [Anabaenopsis arnoldii]MDH6092002.1 alpha-mannosidase [Anabaenopsis arnoldii]MDH6105503.1 alpha-mannosidase [Anabaenopsis tanganyikae CS-531]